MHEKVENLDHIPRLTVALDCLTLDQRVELLGWHAADQVGLYRAGADRVYGNAEICELARSNSVVVRALAHEALTQMPSRLLAGLLRDPVDASMAHIALQRQTHEYLSEEAQRILREFEDSGSESF